MLDLSHLTTLINVPDYHFLFSLLKGFRNGIVYGCKVRFPHSLVMTTLFKDGTVSEKILTILKATKRHARNLALMVFIFKTSHWAQRKVGGIAAFERAPEWFTLISGALAGYFVFGTDNPVDQQVYLVIF